MMQNKEQLIYLFTTNPRLPQNDRRFFVKIGEIIQSTNMITTGQAQLFDQLIEEHYDQLKKTNLTVEQLLALPWKTKIVETSKEYTSARVSLVEDEIIIKVPFNKRFDKKLIDISDNSFRWDNTLKVYRSPADTYSLKLAHTYLPRYFPEVRYCERLTQILNSITGMEKLVWDPTLIYINNNYYVIATNEIVGEFIKDMDLNADPLTLFKLSRFGIKVDKSIIQTDIQKFAANFVAEVDIEKLDEVVEWLSILQVKEVLLGKGTSPLNMNAHSTHKTLIRSLVNKLHLTDIKTYKLKHEINIEEKVPQNAVLIQYHGNETMKFHSNLALAKSVFIRNSIPIEVK